MVFQNPTVSRRLQLIPGIYRVVERDDLLVISLNKGSEPLLMLASCLPATEPGNLVHMCVCVCVSVCLSMFGHWPCWGAGSGREVGLQDIC